jgi:beta-mannosidase
VKYKQIGSFFQFQFVDCWPAVTWSVVSYGRQPKPGFAAMQRAYQPVLITGDLDQSIWSHGDPHTGAPIGLGIAMKLWVVNDRHESIKAATYEARLRGNGQDLLVGKAEEPADLPADDVAELKNLYCTLPTQVELLLKIGDQVISENSYPVTVVP